jgi:hypothetical protein
MSPRHDDTTIYRVRSERGIGSNTACSHSSSLSLGKLLRVGKFGSTMDTVICAYVFPGRRNLRHLMLSAKSPANGAPIKVNRRWTESAIGGSPTE